MAAASVEIALVAIHLNEASFSNNFSTIFRVTRGAKVSVAIFDKDLSGEDPLPPYLSEAKICLGGDEDADKEMGDDRRTSSSDPPAMPQPATPEEELELGLLVSNNNLGP